MDPAITNEQQQINALISTADANLQFPPNRSAEIKDLRERASRLVTDYKQEMIDKTERLIRELKDYRERIQRIVDEVNRST